MIWGTWHIYLDGVYDLLTYSMNILSTAKPLPNMPREDDKRSPTHNTISSHHVFRCSGYKKVVGLGSSVVSWLLTVDSTARHSGGSLSQPLQFIKLSIQVSVFFIVPTSQTYHVSGLNQIIHAQTDGHLFSPHNRGLLIIFLLLLLLPLPVRSPLITYWLGSDVSDIHDIQETHSTGCFSSGEEENA